jgi:hypothetical protein
VETRRLCVGVAVVVWVVLHMAPTSLCRVVEHHPRLRRHAGLEAAAEGPGSDSRRQRQCWDIKIRTTSFTLWPSVCAPTASIICVGMEASLTC